TLLTQFDSEIAQTLAVVIFIWFFVRESTSQNPEIHQAAGITRFTGIYSFLGSFIAIREAYFLASLVCVLAAANIFLTFFQLPSYYLPIHHNQRNLSNWGDAITEYIPYFYALIQILEMAFNESSF
ncbi:unnamed protein product, partial [Allacma fusca]